MEESTSAATSPGTSSWRAFAARSGSELRLVQFVSDLVYGDAASIDCVGWRDTFIRAGIEAPLLASRFDDHHAAVCEPLSAYRYRPGDVILFHYTTWSATADYLERLGRRLVVMYHNVTPPEFFAGLDAQIEWETRRGRERLGELGRLAILGAAKSEFSRRDLVAAGIARTCVVPVRLDFDTLDRERRPTLEDQLRARGPGVMVMGRVVPNKRVEDVLRTFAYLRGRIEPRAQLYCVGAHTPTSPYQNQLDGLVKQLGLEEAVRFTGQVPHADRGAYYRASRVLVTMSEHEGFCAPIVEAMHLGLPVVGFAGGAIPETMGDAGVLIARKRHDVIAEVLGMLLDDTPLRRRVVEKGRTRAATFARERVEAGFAAELAAALG